jgi:hypothetical protein
MSSHVDKTDRYVGIWQDREREKTSTTKVSKNMVHHPVVHNDVSLCLTDSSCLLGPTGDIKHYSR